AGGIEVAVGPRARRRVFDVDPVAIVARAELQAQRIELPVADPEQPGVARLRSGHEGFVADRLEVALRPLQAERAVPAGPRPVHELHASLGTFVLEHRADFAT